MPSIQEIYAAINRAEARGDERSVEVLSNLFERQRRADMGLPPLPAEKDGSTKKEKTEEEAGFLENIATGFGAGFVGTAATAALGAATILEEDDELKARRKILDLQEDFTPEGGDKDSLTYKLFSGVGSLGAFGSTAVLGKAALPAAGILALGAGAGEASERARAYGASERERGAASLRGAAIGTLELIPLGRLAKNLDIPGLPDFIEKLSGKVTPKTITGIRSRLQRMAATGVAEGTQEATAAILQNLNEAGYNPEQVMLEMGVVEEGAIGGGAGAILQGVVDVLNRKNVRATVVEDKLPEQKAAEETVTEKPVEEKTEEKKVDPKEKPKVEEVKSTEDQLEAILEIEGEAETTTEDPESFAPEQILFAAEEKGDVGEQTARTPDTKTTGESVPSSTRVVGDERADGAEEPRGAVEGGLDDSVSDTGRPVRRERESFSPVVTRVYDILLKGNDKDRKNGLAYLKKRMPEAQYAELERRITRVDAAKPESAVKEDTKSKITPAFDLRQKKFTYNQKRYKAFEKDIAPVDRLRLAAIAKRKALPQTPKAITDVVATYMSFFKTPEEALFAAVQDKVDPEANIIQTLNKKDPDKSTQELRQVFKGRSLTAELREKDSKALREAMNVKEGKVNVGEVVLDWANKNLESSTMDNIKALERQTSSEIESVESIVNRVVNAPVTKTDAPEQTAEQVDAIQEKAEDVKDAKVEVVSKDSVKGPSKKKMTQDSKKLAEIEFVDAMRRKDLDLTNMETFDGLLELAQSSLNPKKNEVRLVAKAATAAKKKREDKATQKKVDESIKSIDARKEAGAGTGTKGKPKKKKTYKETKTADVVAKVRKKHKGLTKRQVTAALRLVENQGGSAGASRRVAEYFDKASKQQIIDDAKQYENDKYFRDLERNDLKIGVKNIESLEGFVPTTTLKLIEEGDLKGAVLDFAKTLTGEPASVARAMANNLGDVKVDTRTTEQLGGVVGGRVKQGQFDVGNNTISYNSDISLTGHALLHEVAHAVTNSGLNNKLLPATKQLNNIFKSVKGSLSGAYGAENVKEFVAEVMSNDKFRKELARLDVNGKNIPVLRLVFNAISNRLRALAGLSTKPIERFDMDNLDSLTMALVNTNLDRVGNDTIAMARTPNEILNLAVEVGKATDKYKGAIADKNWAIKASEVLRSANSLFRSTYYKLHGGQAIGDVARAMGFGTLGLRLDKAITEQRGLQMDAEAKLAKLKKKYNKWAFSNRKAKAALDRVIYSRKHGATLYQVDPTKPESNYSGEKLAIWKAQRADWKTAGPEGQALFTEMRNAYKSMYKDLLDAIGVQIDSMVEGEKEAATAIKKKLENRLIASGALDVYFPLVRQGDYKLSFDVQLDDSKEQVFLMFATKAERDAYETELKNDKDVVQSSINAYEGDIEKGIFQTAPSGSFTSEVLEILDKANVSSDVQEAIIKLYVDKLPESSFAKSFRRRKKTMGYIHDAGYALETKGSSLGIQTARIKSSAKIKAIEEEIRQKAKAIPENVNDLRDVLLARGQFARKGAKNKGVESVIKNANQLAFLYTLGFNFSSALVNVSQIPLVIIPFLSGKYGLADTMDAFGSAGNMLGGTTTNIKEYYNQEGTGYDAVFTLKPSVIKKIEDTAIDAEQAKIRIQQLKELIPLVTEANANGQLYSMSFMDELGINEKANMLDKVTHGSAIFFNAAERFNRQTTLIATYNLVRKQMSQYAKEGKDYYSEFDGEYIKPKTTTAELRRLAAREALYLTQQTNGGAVLETAPRLTQEGWMRVAGMYKSFGLQMYYTLLKTTKIMFGNLFPDTARGKEQRNTAFKQLAGIHLSALFFSGISGIPLYGIVSAIFDMFIADDDDDVDTYLRKAIKEGPFKGVVSEMTGLDVASRIKLTDLIINENRFSNSESLEQSIGYYLGGPFISTLNRFGRALGDYNRKDYHEMFDNVLPPAFANVKKAIRYSMDDGIKTRREDYVMRDLTTGELVGKALGFAPTEYTFRQAKNARNKKVERAVLDKAQDLRENYFQAVRRSDPDAIKDIFDEIAEFNKKHPSAAIDNNSLRQSVKRHFETTASMINGVTVNESLRSDIQRSNENWSRGF